MSDPAVRVENLSKSHGATRALSSVSLAVEPGEMFGLIGPDGAGKTTLMRILASLVDADAGEAWVLGHSVRTAAARVRELVGYMPQHFSLYADLTVAENIKFFADLFGVPRAEREERAKELLDFSRLEPFVKRRAGALSGGMKQKLALSCALIHTPRLLLLDEPTTGVDPVSRRDFWEMLERLRARGVTIVVSTPYMNEAALCGHMVFIHKGAILAAGTAGEITALFEGTVIAAEGPDLHAVSARLRSAVEPELVRILGDAVQVLALGARREAVAALVETMRREGVVTRSREIPPGIEDTFVSLMRE